MKRLNPCFLIITATLLLSLFSVQALAQHSTVCAVYFTGIGCPHCAKTDPVLLPQMTSKHNLIIIEYEIYQSRENAPLLYSYNQEYGSGFGIPQIIFGKNDYIKGDAPILSNIEKKLNPIKTNPCPLINATTQFERLDLSSLPGKPKIWANNRILIYNGGGGDSKKLTSLIIAKNITLALKEIAYTTIPPSPVQLSGRVLNFEHAISLGGWIFQWNGEEISNSTSGNPTFSGNEKKPDVALTLTKILSLAAIDAINPCALAVLTLMLIAIITYNPKKKLNVLLAGASFTFSVFLIYMLYGLILIKFFQLVQALTSIRLVLYQALAVIAIILGIFNVKDFFSYKPGGLMREMPMSWRPKVKKLIEGITSPKGAFVVGAFVTIFLLPCTIGPYIIASGMLSVFDIVKTIPWLILYNIVFVSPMLAITLLVYMGTARVNDISGWKDKNIKKLHLIAGFIMLILGISMLLGWI